MILRLTIHINKASTLKAKKIKQVGFTGYELNMIVPMSYSLLSSNVVRDGNFHINCMLHFTDMHGKL